LLVAVTDHAALRFRQRVRGTLDPKAEIVGRVRAGLDAGGPEPGDRGRWLVRDQSLAGLLYVCRREGDELIVVTLWEEGEHATVPKRFTDALKRDDHHVGDV
jgi:hypothetical protein